MRSTITTIKKHKYPLLILLGLSIISLYSLTSTVKLPSSKSPNVTEKPKKMTVEVNGFKPINSFSVSNPSLVKEGVLIALNQSSLLTKYSPDTASLLHPNPISVFGHNSNTVAFIEKKDPSSLKIQSLDSSTKLTVSVKDFLPIISITVSSETNAIYFLGKYDSNTRRSDIYYLNTLNRDIKLLNSTYANNIQWLNPDLLLLFMSSDGPDDSIFSFYKISATTSPLELKGNYSHLSPDSKFVALAKTNSISLVNLEKLRDVSIPNNTLHLSWKNNITLLSAKNLNPGVQITYYSIPDLVPTFSFITQESISIRRIIGTSDNTLYYVNGASTVESLTLPEVKP